MPASAVPPTPTIAAVPGAAGSAPAQPVLRITAEALKWFAPLCVDPRTHAAALEAARATSTVNTPVRLAHIMGQLFVESAGFTRLEENFRWRDAARLAATFKAVTDADHARELIAAGPMAIACCVYASRLGNGDEASSDGWRYRGSGYMQLTGRGNFRAMGRSLGLDLEAVPELVRQPPIAARVAFGFWDTNACSGLADKADVAAITRRINGPALMHLAERRRATEAALRIWC